MRDGKERKEVLPSTAPTGKQCAFLPVFPMFLLNGCPDADVILDTVPTICYSGGG